jgi:probable phosphomutase (TIGR03848 family)
MPTLLLIRHGENDFLKQGRLPGRLPDIHLNERGREQSVALAETLKTAPIRAIYSSPLERAVETAEPLARILGLPIQIRPALLDTDVGEWQGLYLKELRKLSLWKQVHAHPSTFRFPGGESFIEFQQRLVSEIESLVVAHKPKDMLAVVFHSDPIKLVLAHFLGLPLDNFQKLGVSPGSVSILVIGKFGSFLAGLNHKPPFALEK